MLVVANARQASNYFAEHHVRTTLSAALESGKCRFQDPAQFERKMAMGGLYVSFHKKGYI